MRPPLLGNLDEDVQDYIKDLRISGGIINTNIVRCIGRGVLLHKDKFQLEEFGGPVCLSKEWAQYSEQFSVQLGPDWSKYDPSVFLDNGTIRRETSQRRRVWG